jgi:hypothetical protein
VLEAATRVSAGDQVIDLVIAIETLTTRDTASQLSYQSRTYGALILGDNYERRTGYRDLLQRAYNERSNIVHRNRESGYGQEDLAELADAARRICLRYVTEDEPDFDALIFGD